jgi:hypothetical protein
MKIKLLPLILLISIVFLFFSSFVIQNKLPIPSDTIIGLYHPFRDLYVKDYPNGIPYKNFLITDPVRQQFPWRNLVVNYEKNFELPLWSPYNFAGAPLLANFQSAAFYPLNILFFILPFEYGWSILILLQPLMAGVFLYIYLRNLQISSYACFLGAIAFSFGGFSMAWLEWGTIGHTALWLPLILLSVDKIFNNSSNTQFFNFQFLPAGRQGSIFNGKIKIRKIFVWSLVFLFSLVSSFFAGHLQTFFYMSLVTTAYFVFRWWETGKSKSIIWLFLVLNTLFLILTAIQWWPTLQFISQSARGVDQIWQRPGWFIPWQNAIQFFSPDFFGNPATLNYWGEFNYAEFVGYVGIFPIMISIMAVFAKKKEALFFGIIFLLSIVFSFPTVLAKIPYSLQFPLLSTSQPTRLLFLTDFAISVLAAFGFDVLIRNLGKTKKVVLPIAIFAVIFGALWYFVLRGHNTYPLISAENISVAKRNIYLPTVLFFVSSALVVLHQFIKNHKYKSILVIVLILLTIFDLFRFFSKFTTFSDKAYLFPDTKALIYLQEQSGHFRIMTTDERIMPPNFSAMYNLSSIDGYDPLYLMRYGELMAAIKREKPDISSPFGFNRIVTQHNFDSQLIDLMGVRYVLSLSDLSASKLEKVYSEGQTKIYKNNSAYPRTFFINNIAKATDKNEAIKKMFDSSIDFRDTAIVENYSESKISFTKGTANIVEYKNNSIAIEVNNTDEGFLVLMDTYYPTWSAQICSSDLTSCNSTKIFLTNYNFRGVQVPPGSYRVIFSNSLL